MKYLSIIIPCYNSEDYMERSIGSALTAGEDVEIIIVNDGSSDKTQEIADSYRDAFPRIVKVIRQENKGHGGAINSGLKEVSGKYIKVLDSDDWFDATSLQKIINYIKTDTDVDMIINNYIYDKVDVKNKKVISYHKHLPQDEIISWDMFSLPIGKYLLMHSIVFKTEILIQNELKLPEHTFYVDNIFVYESLMHIKSMIYINKNLYHYFIGREDQSVNEDIMIKRIDQQIKVNKRMFNYYSEHRTSITNESLDEYMLEYLEIITTVSNVLMLKGGTKTLLKKKDNLWDYFEANDPEVYRKLRTRFLGRSMNMKGYIGRKTVVLAYQFAQRTFGFN